LELRGCRVIWRTKTTMWWLKDCDEWEWFDRFWPTFGGLSVWVHSSSLSFKLFDSQWSCLIALYITSFSIERVWIVPKSLSPLFDN
jgi:hypothetical protein